MNKRIVKICSMIMVLSLITLSFASCKGGKSYEKTEGTTASGETPPTSQTAQNETVGNRNPLTGLEISADAVGKRPVAIMVENSPQARPQWGLSTPDVVIEGVVEGGITRMMWLYADASEIPKVGPVRSARHDYVETAKGLNAIYFHSGGSKPLAYDAMANLNLTHVDGLTTEGKYFFRDAQRRKTTAIEHTLYTNGDYIQKAIADNKISTAASDTSWTPYTVIANGERIPFGYPEKNGGAYEVSVQFSPSYKHTFKYNADEKLYYNYLNGKEMKDGNNNKTMAVTNVIVMYCDTKTVDSVGHQDWNLEDTQGKALYVTYGKGEQITWKKASKSAPLKFYGSDGKELTVNKGQTWIGIIPLANKDKTSIKVG